MTQHITQEVAIELSIKAGDEFAIHEAEFYTNLCNAAIQHYLDQHKAELPVLPEPSVCAGENYGEWTFEVDHFTKSKTEAYGQQCAAHARELALEEAKQAAENCDVVEVKGSTYYAQLSYAAATQRGIVAAIEALKGK